MSQRERFSTLGTVRVKNQYDRPRRFTIFESFLISGTERRFAHSGQKIESHGHGSSFTSPPALCHTSNHSPHVASDLACFSRPHLFRESTTRCVIESRRRARSKMAP